jgi:hypothetical protein
MDTIQVDAKKLQLLNDRINQTIDALNHLRFTAQQAGVGLGHSTLGGPVSPYAQYAATFGAQAVPGVYGYQQAAFDPSIVARQQAMQAMMAQWAMGGLGHTTLPYGYGAIPSAYAQAFPGAFGVPGVYGGLGHSTLPYNYNYNYGALQSAFTPAIPGVFGVQQPIWGAGLGHTTLRSPAAELICGTFDPALRQAEVARACEANRAWEVNQGLSHTTLPAVQASLYGAPFAAACAPFVTAQNPWMSAFGC